MPTYEYKCPICEFRFELMQGIKDKPKRVCPCCKKRKLIRLIGAGGGILFKGAGFYQTEYVTPPKKETGE